MATATVAGLLLESPAAPPATTHYLKLLQVFEPRNLTAEIQACRQYGFTGLLVKALDGAVWMEAYDGSHDALGSVVEVQLQAQIARLAGLYYFAWTNPLQGNLDTQATLTAQIANLCDGVFLDVEPYAQFWGPNAPAGRASGYMQSIRNMAPDAFLALQPDPRPAALQAIRWGEWMQYCDALAGQHYWSDFSTDPTAELERAVSLGQAWGKPVLPTLPGNAGGSWPANMISIFPGFVVWRWGTTPAATMAMLGSLPVTGLHTDRIRALT